MNQIILIGDKNHFSMKTNKILWVTSGVLYIGVGVFQIYRYQNEDLGFLVWSYLILGGLYFILYSFLGLSEKSKYAPKVHINEDFIHIKKSFWKAARQIKWSDISSINFKSYQIDFKLNKETYTFSYNTTSNTSIEIKRAIRSIAENKGVEVIGG